MSDIIYPPDVSIRSMQQADLAFAAECTASEGWISETYSVFEGFYLYDPRGCLLAEMDGRPVGICIATLYNGAASGSRCGFIGELIVRPEVRERGVGAALLNHAVRYLQTHGAETVYLDGVVKAVALYERNGFRKVCLSLRFSGLPSGRRHPEVRPMTAQDLPAVFALDRQVWGADRSFFIKRRLDFYPELCKVLLSSGHVNDISGGISGFIQGRRGEGYVAAGPWVVAADVADPLKLFESLACEVGDASQISVGVLESNTRAVELVRSLGMVERSDCPWRMALGSASDLGASPQCLAMGGAAKG